MFHAFMYPRNHCTLTWCLMSSSFLWPQSTMISNGKVKDNISTYLLLLHWNAGKPVPLLSFWHILESSFPPPLNHGKDPWELPVEHFGSKHLVKLVKWRVKEQCRPLGCNQSHPTAHRTGDKLEMVVLHVLRETFNIQFNHREGFNDSATSNWVLKLPKLLLNVKSLAVLSYPPGLPGKCRPAALRLQLCMRRSSRGWYNESECMPTIQVWTPNVTNQLDGNNKYNWNRNSLQHQVFFHQTMFSSYKFFPIFPSLEPQIK